MRLLVRAYQRVFARRVFKGLNTALYTAALRGLGVLNYEDDGVSGERYLIQEYLPEKIENPSPVILDVGANVGSRAVALARVFPEATIHAFEPHPQNYDQLRNNLHDLPQVRCHNLALGKASGQVTLYDRADREGSTHASLHSDVISDIHQQPVKAVRVSIDTLDNIAAENGITRVDYLKIDTEGNELAVLEGASRMLRERRLVYIHLEFNEMNIVSKVSMREFRKILQGYDLYRLLPRGLLPLDSRIPTTEIYAYQNILAVPNKR